MDRSTEATSAPCRSASHRTPRCDSCNSTSAAQPAIPRARSRGSTPSSTGPHPSPATPSSTCWATLRRRRLSPARMIFDTYRIGRQRVLFYWDADDISPQTIVVGRKA
ncbi:hypothetical protein IOD13_18120 [Brevibacterium casei]|nr:hypothetical protein [Brevibacterium casei]